jgi:hypothetical protein
MKPETQSQSPETHDATVVLQQGNFLIPPARWIGITVLASPVSTCLHGRFS